MVSDSSHWQIFLPTLLLGATALLVLIWRRMRRGNVVDASCGHCGYLVVGLTGPICPECGSNLSEVGIRLPGDVRPMPRLLRGLIFTLLYVALIALIFPLIAPILPRWYSIASSLEMSYPVSRDYHSVSAIASGSGWSPMAKFDHVDLTLVPRDGESRLLRIDIEPSASDATIELARQEDQSITVHDIRDVTPQLVLRWMNMFVGPDMAALRDEAESVSVETIKLASSDAQVQQTTPQRTPFSSLKFRQWPAGTVISWCVIIPLIIVGLAIWLIGVIFIVRDVPGGSRREITHA